MAFTVADVEEFIALLREHPEWRQRVHDEIVGEDIARMNARFEKTDQLLDKIAKDIERIWAAIEEMRAAIVALNVKVESIDQRLDGMDRRFDGVDARFDGVDARFDGVDARFDRVDARLVGADARLGHVEGRLGNLEGADYERKFNALSRVAKPFRRAESISLTDAPELADARDSGVFSPAEVTQIASLDHLIRVRRGPGPDAPEAYIAFEVSKTVDARDVRRAAERAALLRRAGLDAVAYAGGQVVTAGASELADDLGVVLVIDRPDGDDS